MRKYQRGATMWSTLAIAGMIAFITYFGFSVGSIYLDYKFIKGSMQEVVNQRDFKKMSPRDIIVTINKRLTIDNIRGLDKDVIKVKKDRTGEKYLQLNYVAKTHLFAEVHALVEFNEEVRATK